MKLHYKICNYYISHFLFSFLTRVLPSTGLLPKCCSAVKFSFLKITNFIPDVRYSFFFFNDKLPFRTMKRTRCSKLNSEKKTVDPALHQLFTMQKTVHRYLTKMFGCFYTVQVFINAAVVALLIPSSKRIAFLQFDQHCQKNVEQKNCISSKELLY